MNNNYSSSMSNKYKSVDVGSRVETASQHELILLLLQGARTHIASAIGSLQRKEISKKGEHIGKAIDILDGLQICLDHERGGDVAKNLLLFYKQIQSLLLNANLKNDELLLTKSNELLAEILEAWKAMKITEQE